MTPVEPAARASTDYLKLDPNISAADYTRRMAELRDNKPRPIDKLWRNPETAPPDKVAAAREALSAWNREYRQVSANQKLALERDNAAYRAGEEPGAVTSAAEATRAEALTTEPDHVVPNQYVAKDAQGEVVGKGPTSEAALADARGEVVPGPDEAPVVTPIAPTEPSGLGRRGIAPAEQPARPNTQADRLTRVRDELAAKTDRTSYENTRLKQLDQQLERLQKAEERRAGIKQPFTGPPMAGKPKDFLDYKFNDGTSVFKEVFREAGHDPEQAVNMKIQHQTRVLSRHMETKFGFSGVEVRGMKGREATPVEHKEARDAMLDMTRAIQDGMATLGLPYDAASLGGKLKLVIDPAPQKYYGEYRGTTPGEISVVAGANSYGHEWTHAWDHELTQWATKYPAQASDLFSRYTRDGNLDPTNDVHAAFAKIINTLTFDQGGLLHKQLELETAAQKVDRQGNPTKAALEAQRQLELLEKGGSKLKIQPSQFRSASAQLQPNKASYWASAHEMLARAHEAYLGWKMALEGKDPRGFVMPDEAYLAETDRQLKLAYPKAEDRVRIFEAFDELHEALKKEQILSQGKPPGGFTDYKQFDPTHWQVTAPEATGNRLFQALKTEGRRYGNLAEGVARVSLYDRNRPPGAGGRTQITGFKDGFRAATFSIHGIMESLIERAPKAAQPKFRALMDLVAAAPGEGRYTAANFEEAVRTRSRGWMARFGNILKVAGLEPDTMTAKQNDMIRHAMTTGETRYQNAPIPQNLVTAAGQLRGLMDHIWQTSRKAGLDVGYSSRYFPRLYDMHKFFSDPEAFTRQAKELYSFMFDKDIGTPGSTPDAFLEKWTSLGKVDKATAAQNNPGLESAMQALGKNLRRQREIENNPTPTPAEQAELRALKGQAETLARDNHDGLRDHVAGIAADHWNLRMMNGGHADYDTIGPSGKYLNARVLPPEADTIMKDFMHTDPRDVIPNYIHAASRKVAYTERFGAQGEHLQAAYDEIAKVKGINGEDLRYFKNLMEMATGRTKYTGAFMNQLQSIHNVLHTIGSLALMPRAVWSAFAEPMNAAMATGNARLGFKILGEQMRFLWDKAGAAEHTEFADFHSVTTSAMYDSIILSRMSADYSDSPLLNKLMTMYYKTTGLTQLTNSQRRATAVGSNWFLAKLARDYQDQGTGTRAINGRDNATRWFDELGIHQSLHKDFAAWMTDLKGDLPSIDRLQKDDMAGAYGLAIRRLTDRIIQDPYKVDRAALSSVPVIGLAFQMMSFNYQMQRNILGPMMAGVEHAYGRAKLAAYAGGAGGVSARAQGLVMGGGAAVHAASMAATAVAAGLVTTTLRQLLFAPDQWKKHEEEGTLLEYLRDLAMQRAGLNGTLDPIIQMGTNLRYNADITSLMGGAALNWIAHNSNDMLQPFLTANDSPDSNTRIWNATRGAYNMFGVPLMAGGLTALGNLGGPVSQFASGAAMQYLTSPGAAAAATDILVGSEKGAKRAKEGDEFEQLPSETEALPKIDEATGEPAGGGGLFGIPKAGVALLDDVAVPAFRYGAPIIAGLPRTIKAGAVGAAALYGAAKYREATEGFVPGSAPEPKAKAQ